MHVEKEIPYREIPDFPVSTVQGHDGRFLLGWIGKVPVVVMKGRVHYYEGYSMEEVVLPVRLMKKMGIEILFLTNASICRLQDRILKARQRLKCMDFWGQMP